MADRKGKGYAPSSWWRAHLRRGRQQHLPALLRYPIIVSIGALVAVLASVLLRKIGY